MERNNKLVNQLIPQSPSSIRAASRGAFNTKEIELVIKDIGIRQAFLNRDIHPNARRNLYISSISKKVKLKEPVENIAKSIRKSLGIDLNELRTKKTKAEALVYLVSCVENSSIYVSFSTHHYMPQVIDRRAQFSGICIKDNFFPFIFINTRDGDDDPLFFESEGRQIYTMLVLLVCIALNKFQEINIDKQSHNGLDKLTYNIASEIIIPKSDVCHYSLKNYEDLIKISKYFAVTPSMCLFRFFELGLIDSKLNDELRLILLEKRPKKGGRSKKNQIHLKYLKYNGKKYSRDIFSAEKSRKIPRSKVMSALFKKNRFVDINFIKNYKSAL